MSGTVFDFDLHGVVRVRVQDAEPADAAKVARQLGLPAAEPAGPADLTIRFVDVATRRPLTYVGVARHRLQPRRVLRAREPGRQDRTDPDPVATSTSGREIVCERSVDAVPHLLSLVNLVALSKDVLPLHASAFSVGGLNVLVTGWSKGGKTESPAGRHGTRWLLRGRRMGLPHSGARDARTS